MTAQLVALAVVLAPADFKPVKVVVVDAATGASLPEFIYQAWYDAPGVTSPPNGDAWTRVSRPDGTFELNVPVACRLRVFAKAPDFVGGYIHELQNEFAIRSTDEPRRVVVRLRRGIAVRGTVRDEQTKQPVAGAVVAPVILMVPLHVGDDEKQVKTGADGRYELRGVDPLMGVTASHPDYLDDLPHPDGKTQTGPDHDVLLKRGATVAATVLDPEGRPLAGGRADGATSGPDGKIVVRNVGLPPVLLHKEGYIDKFLGVDDVARESAKPGGIVVTMERTIPLAGRVVGPDGRPVLAFTVAAGPEPLPSGYGSIRRDVRDGDGRFRLDVSKVGPTWIGVKAEGFAAWEGSVDVKRGVGPQEVRLSPGVTVTARVEPREALRRPVIARLIPRRDRSQSGGRGITTLSEEFAIRESEPGADGSFRFERVRPDGYRLAFARPGAPRDNDAGEADLALDVPAGGLDAVAVAVPIPVPDAPTAARGSIAGRVWHPEEKGGGPWAFANGYVGGFRFGGFADDGRPSITFQADENGRFRVDGVPAGQTIVGFPYQVYDVITSFAWQVVVAENRTTTLGAFEPGDPRRLTLAFAVGDGSEAQYLSGTGLAAARKVENVTVTDAMLARFGDRPQKPKPPGFDLDLSAVSKDPLAFGPHDGDLDTSHKIVLPDIGPGTYRLTVRDRQGRRGYDSGPLVEREVVVPPGGAGEVKVELGAGCITGKIRPPGGLSMEPVAVTAVAEGAQPPSRRAFCDFNGHFCLRYLAPGRYTLFANHPGTGYCRVDGVAVPAGVVDVGEHALSPGSTAQVRIRFRKPSRLPERVTLVGPSGVTIRHEFESYSSFDRAEFAGLWPGRWRISATRGDDVLASETIIVEATGAYSLNLAVGEAARP